MASKQLNGTGPKRNHVPLSPYATGAVRAIRKPHFFLIPACRRGEICVCTVRRSRRRVVPFKVIALQVFRISNLASHPFFPLCIAWGIAF